MTRHAAISCSLALALLVALPGAALAGQKPITGKLSKPGYTVLALGYNGKSASSSKRSFRIVPRDGKVTLQLRDSKGRYAGPVVVGGKGSSVIVGVKAGAKLGTIKVARGYGMAAHVAAKSVDKRRTAKARKGVPLGNGLNFGLVRSAAHAAAGKGRDGDLDGVPDALDVDANGNLVLNNEEPAGRSARAAAIDPNGFHVFSQIGAPLERSLNANASGVSDAAIDALVQGSTSPPNFQPIGTFLDFQVVPGDQVELDCGGLSYCSKGGSGKVRAPGGFDPALSFPDCCDGDGDGFGTMTTTPGPGGQEFQLYPLATAAQINSGDVLIERSTTGGVETDQPTTLNFVFNTTPALTSWTSSGGQSGSVTYPVSSGAAGTSQDPFAVAPGPDGNVAVTMTFWRPQRRGIAGAGEGTGFIDIGHLLWTARLIPEHQGQGGGGQVIDCPTGYSTSDPNLVPAANSPIGGLVDQAADAPANPANTLTYTLNLSDCLASKGVAWNVGDAMQLEIVARSQTGGDNSAQQVFFKRAA